MTEGQIAASDAPTDAPAAPPDPPENSSEIVTPARSRTPRWLVVLAWSTGPAGLYALASLAHAALVERILTVDVGFGRSLAFWIGSIYLALLAWGFLPIRPGAWYARRRAVLAALAVGAAGAAICGVYAGLWLSSHWVQSVGAPVAASIVVLVAAAVAVLWLADRDERRPVRVD